MNSALNFIDEMSTDMEELMPVGEGPMLAEGALTPLSGDDEDGAIGGILPVVPWDGEFPWDTSEDWEREDMRGLLDVDLGFEELGDAQLEDATGKEAVVYGPSAPTTLETRDVQEMEEWTTAAEELRDRADDQRAANEFDLWLVTRYRHDAARHVIGRLLKDLVFLRKGTFRELWDLPTIPEKVTPFGDLHWLPAAEISQEEDDLWEEYSQLLDGLNILRRYLAPAPAMMAIERRIDTVLIGINGFLDEQRKVNKTIVEKRTREYACLLAKDKEEESEEEKLREEERERQEEDEAREKRRKEEGEEEERQKELKTAVALVTAMLEELEAQEPPAEIGVVKEFDIYN